jgi:hypothetical protein
MNGSHPVFDRAARARLEARQRLCAAATSACLALALIIFVYTFRRVLHG